MFTYDDSVRVIQDAPTHLRPGSVCSIVGVTSDNERRGSHFEQFPTGTVYLVEFSDGSAVDVHEDMVEGLE